MLTTELILLLVGAILAALTAFVVTPAVSVLAYKIGAIDVPKDGRRMHKKPIPRIGGLAIFTGFVFASLLFCKLSPSVVAIYIGGLIIIAVGVIDDVFRINAWIKLVAQIAAALIAVSQGVVVEYVNLFGNYIQFGVWAIPITVIWIVGLTNAINLIDGLDGLACGVSAICSASILLVMLLKGDMASATITAILVGACLGFLPFNSNPAKIFMGDTGALFLGYAMAVISVSGVFKLHTVVSFIIPISIFGLPLFDTAFAFIRRIIHGRSPFSSDRGHLHHRLIDMGFNQKQSVFILYAICAILGTSAIMFTEENYGKAAMIIVFGIFVLVLNSVILHHESMKSKMGIDFGDASDSKANTDNRCETPSDNTDKL